MNKEITEKKPEVIWQEDEGNISSYRVVQTSNGKFHPEYRQLDNAMGDETWTSCQWESSWAMQMLQNLLTASKNPRPIDVAVALSLYDFLVCDTARAKAIYKHFDGNCAEMSNLIAIMKGRNAATELAPPSAKVYVDQAVTMYGEEAVRRNRVNEI